MSSKHFEVINRVVRKPRHGATDAGHLRAEIERGQPHEAEVSAVRIVDFSRAGCRLRSSESLLDGEPIVLRLHDEASGLLLEVIGLARWSKEVEGGYESGCEFNTPIDYEQLGELFLSGFLSLEDAGMYHSPYERHLVSRLGQVGNLSYESASPRRHAAVDAQRLPSHERSFFAGEVVHGERHVVWHAPAASGNEGKILFLKILWIFFVSLDRNPTRSHRVDGNPMRGKFTGHAPRPANLPPLGRHIGAKVWHAAMKHFTGNVDQSTPALFLHRRKRPPGQ